MVKSFKKRYLAVKITSDINFSKEKFIDKFIKSVADLELNKQNFRFIDIGKNDTYIIKCSNKSVNKLKKNTVLLDSINIKIIGVSGTIKALKRKFIKN